jgi:hypothetical protein
MGSELIGKPTCSSLRVVAVTSSKSEISPKLSVQRRRRHRLDEGLTQGPSGVREPAPFENLLALQPTDGVASKAVDERFARRQLIQAGAELGQH